MADYQYLTHEGVILPDTASTLETVEIEFRNAFGNDLDLSPQTPQGVLISAETKARDSVLKNNAALANQINPNIAGGIFLDAIFALTGGKRMGAEPSILREVLLNGESGTLIPAGFQASNGMNGVVFELISAVTLNENGQAFGTFQAIDTGAIAVAKNTLTTILTPILGLESITNTNEAEMGKDVESDAAARLRRRKILALQGVALPEAIVSALFDKTQIEGVKSLSFLENTTHETMTLDGISLKPHSIYICIDGGRDEDIAKILLKNKSLGCGYNGKVKVEVVEETSNIVYPVSFDRPEIVTIFAKVKISNVKALSNPQQTIREALLSYSNGEIDGETGFGVSIDVSPFELASAINKANPSLFVEDLSLSRDGQNYSQSTIKIATNQLAHMTTGTIEVIVL